MNCPCIAKDEGPYHKIRHRGLGRINELNPDDMAFRKKNRNFGVSAFARIGSVFVNDNCWCAVRNSANHWRADAQRNSVRGQQGKCQLGPGL